MPSDPTKEKTISPLKSVQDAIRTRMHNAEDPSDASRVFICEDDLQRAWQNHDLKTIFPPTKYSREELETIRDRFLRVLSVLIFIGWSSDDLVNKFRSQFLRVVGREDNNLPMNKEKLEEFLDTSFYMFWQHQFAFCPAIIQESGYSHIQRIETDRRLPFSGKPVEVGGGAYGMVSQVTIAPRCLRHTENGTDNFKPMVVACKTYTNENSAENFHRESENLDILKEGLMGSKRIMQHIASIIHGNNFMILLPLARHGDLEIFLRGGYKPGADTRYYHKIYDFDATFPQLSCEETLHRALLKEMFEIARALVWLHEELHLFGKLDEYLAHLDLKPENILLVQNNHSGTAGSDHPAGKWMLTDFGVSVFDKATNEKATRVHSIRDVGPRLTSRANRAEVMRGYGPYQPPEVDLDKVDGRKCDVWSLACILCDVLAFAFGRGTALHRFRALRYDGRDDYFYRARGSSENQPRVINSSNTELKSEIRDWFRSHAYASIHTWVPHYVSIIERALVPGPRERPDMKLIMHGLGSLPVNVRSSPETLDHFRSSDRLRPQQTQRPSDTSNGTANTSSNSFSPTVHITGASTADRFSFYDTPEVITQPFPAYEYRRYPSTSTSNTEASYLQDGNIPVGKVLSIPSTSNTEASYPQYGNLPVDKVLSVPIPKLQPLRKASEYKRASRSSPILNSKQSVDAVAVTPTGDKVAFLCGRHIHAYLTCDGSKAGTIEELAPEDTTPPVKWKKLCIANGFAVTYGLKGLKGTEKFIQVREFGSGREVTTVPVTLNNEQASDILLSNRDVVVCVYTRRLYLASLSGGESKELEIGGGEDLAIKAACFSENGDLLFVWASGKVHRGYLYGMNGDDATLIGEVSYEKAANDSKDFTLWPYESMPACIVYNSHGSTFVIHPNTDLQEQPQKRQSLIIPSALVGRVARDNVLICIQKGLMKGRKPKIFEYELSKGTDERFLISKSSDSLASVEYSVDETAKIALGLYEDQLLLSLCTMKGEITKYIRKS